MRARRDRHGRGARGPIAPAELPVTRSRAEMFDELVLDAVERLEGRWADQLRGVEFAVEDVPDPSAPWTRGSHDGPIPLSRLFPGAQNRPTRIVIYRRPLEIRALDQEDLADLVHTIVVEEVADLLDLDPDVVDPFDER